MAIGLQRYETKLPDTAFAPIQTHTVIFLWFPLLYVLGPTCKGKHLIFVFLCLTHFTQHVLQLCPNDSFKKFYLFIWKVVTERREEEKKGWWGERVFHLLFHPPSGCNRQGLGQAPSIPSWFSACGEGSSSPGYHLLPSQVHWQGAVQEEEQPGFKQSSNCYRCQCLRIGKATAPQCWPFPNGSYPFQDSTCV